MEYNLKKFDTERIDFIEALAKESELEGFGFMKSVGDHESHIIVVE